MHARDDVGGNQTVAHPLARIRARAHRRIHRARLAAHQHRHVSAAHKLASDQPHFRRLGHRVRRLDGRHQTARFDHAQGNASISVTHVSPLLD